MNQEQFGQFWPQLKAPLKAQWGKITDEDLLEVQGNLGTFSGILQKRYGEMQKEEVNTWANRRYAHWSGKLHRVSGSEADVLTQSQSEEVVVCRSATLPDHKHLRERERVRCEKSLLTRATKVFA